MLGSWNRHFADLPQPRARQTATLDRLIAAAGSRHFAARRGLALAAAEEAREAAHRTAMIARAGDLEARALEALAGGREDLALRAAEAVAVLETEVAASQAAATRFEAKVAAARREVDAQRRRLAELDRGRRLARIGEALAGSGHPLDVMPPLTRAEAALRAIEAAQTGDEAVAAELASSAETLAVEMAEAGFGRPTRTQPSEVLARLRARATQSALLPQRATTHA